MMISIKTQKKSNKRLKLANAKRGSVLLLVLGMLAILLLLAIGFSYTTRLETQTGQNYAELTKARSAAATGLPFAASLLSRSSTGMASLNQPWNIVPQAMSTIKQSSSTGKSVQESSYKQLTDAGVAINKSGDKNTTSTPQADISISDLSGKINLNAIQSDLAVERVVKSLLPKGNTKVQTNAIVALRGQPLDLDNKEMVKSQLDPRTTSTKEVLKSLSQLRIGINKETPIFTDKEIETLAKNVTIFSQSPEVFNLEDGTSIPKVALNIVEPQVTYDTLKKAFPKKSNDLLLQFAANVTDFTDKDSTPTLFNRSGKVITKNNQTDLETSIAGNNVILGIEQTPFISEVYPDSVTPAAQGDGGQFIELINPWNKSLSLNGWQLKINGGSTVVINETLPPLSRLVITDNYDSARADTEAGQGSILAIFGATKDDITKKLLIINGLNIPDRNSRAVLYDGHNNLIDYFHYGSPGTNDSKKSFQRTDIFARGSQVAEATPFTAGTGESSHSSYAIEIRKAWENGNAPIEKISDVLRISSAFTGSSSAEISNGDTNQTYPGQFPELRIAANPANSSSETTEEQFPTNMDLRVIDVFTATPWEAPVAENPNDDDNSIDPRTGLPKKSKSNSKNEKATLAARAKNKEKETTSSLVFSYGKLNVNTCSATAFLGIELGNNTAPGDTIDSTLIAEIETYKRQQVLSDKTPFRNLSDFIGRFAAQISRSNLESLDRLVDQVTVGSSSFEIVATNRLSEAEQKALDDKKSGRRPTVTTLKWTISTDSKPFNVVDLTSNP